MKINEQERARLGFNCYDILALVKQIATNVKSILRQLDMPPPVEFGAVAKLLEMPIEEFDWNVRIVNALWSNNIKTIGQLAYHTEDQLLRLSGIGKKSLTEIKEKLAELGLHLCLRQL